MDINNSKRQQTLLLHFIREECYQISRLTDTGEANDFKTAMDQLTKYFQPKRNIEFEKYTFCQATQKEGETLDEYYT